MLNVLDIFFVVFHSALILFNLFGWILKKTRKLNLLSLLLTGLSWFVLGVFYGIGYCPLTDWHWQVLESSGSNIHVDSYIQYLIERLFNLSIPAHTVDVVTVIAFFVALLLSLYINFYKHMGKRN